MRAAPPGTRRFLTPLPAPAPLPVRSACGPRRSAGCRRLCRRTPPRPAPSAHSPGSAPTSASARWARRPIGRRTPRRP
ncbi:hypothetical protein G6F58_013049 [Rhizopus delemar]|nr:hypothetical protein G6F58_013049 [Rhizopus delemar]